VRGHQPLSLQLHHTDVLSFNRYSQKELYNLVADVESYRHFLPFCHASKVLNASRPNWKSDPGDGPTELEAELRVGFLGLEESYVSRVLCNPYESVEVRNILARGPSMLLISYLCAHNRLTLPHPLPYSKLSLHRGGSSPHHQHRRIRRRHLYTGRHLISVGPLTTTKPTPTNRTTSPRRLLHC
jgi:ribosome-associated toxin RatA of RatAB toxin-antitoxin module